MAILVRLFEFIRDMPVVSLVFLSLAVFALFLLLVFLLITKKKSSNQNLKIIPEILYKMHQRLTALVGKQIRENPINLETIGNDYLELIELNESKYPELKQITATSDPRTDRQIMGDVLKKLLKDLTDKEDVELLASRISNLMSYKGLGVKDLEDNDDRLKKLKRELEQTRPQMPKELSEAVNSYLKSSSFANSINILLSSLPMEKIESGLPVWAKADIFGYRKLLEDSMNDLLGEVTDIIHKLKSENRSRNAREKE